MTTVVERMARAMRPDLWTPAADKKIAAGNASIVGQRMKATLQALAALEALRVPSQTMLDAVCSDSPYENVFKDDVMRGVFREMIDAAISEHKERT